MNSVEQATTPAKNEQSESEIELRNFLQVDEILFEDPSCKVAFKSFAASWEENETKPNEPDYQEKKDFLIRYGRTLANEHSGLNLQAIDNNEINASQYIDDFEEIEKAKNRIEAYKNFIDTELTDNIKTLIAQRGPDSLLGEIRSKMGITDDKELPFEVLVLNASVQPKFNSKTQELDKSEWEEVMGMDTEAFVETDADGKNYLVLHSQTAQDLAGNEMSQNHAKGLISHEYFHTQRKLRFGKSTELGRILDEHMAIKLTDSGGHMDARIIVRTIYDSCTQEEQAKLLESANAAATSDEGSEQYYQKLSEILGPYGMLLLTASQPKAYPDPGAVGEIPGIRQDAQYRSSDLLAQLITERSKVNPNALNILDDQFNSLSEEEARIVKFAHSYSKVKLPDRWQQIIESKTSGAEPSSILNQLST